ncbi:glycosyltransferase family 4 protein [Alicyclobacillus curvatus]|nr:glycosyltransferase family 4 protein [Alicyclobacillus curvatus]
MHILIVAPEGLPIPPAKGGSVQIYVHNLIRALVGRDNLKVTLLSPGSQGTRLHESGLTHEVYRGRAITNVPYEQWILQQILRHKPDVVQVENRPKLAHQILRLRSRTAVLRTTKVVLNLHSTTFLGPMHGAQKLIGQTLRDIDAVVTNSHYLKRVTMRRFGIPEHSFPATVIYPGVDLNRFATPITQETNGDESRLGQGGNVGGGINGSASGSTGGSRNSQSGPGTDGGGRSQAWSLRQPLRLIFVGRVIQLKGVAVLIEAVRQLTRRGLPVKLTIVGKTPPWERNYGLRAHKASRGLPIQWQGFVSPARLPKLLASHHLLILPSQRREAFGLVNLEAMAAGLPVIGSRVGGIPEVVTKDTGVLVEDYSSPKAFADAIARLLDDPQTYGQLRTGAIKRSKEFTWQNTATHFERLYRQLVP